MVLSSLAPFPYLSFALSFAAHALSLSFAAHALSFSLRATNGRVRRSDRLCSGDIDLSD
jgi:hypothetical protein